MTLQYASTLQSLDLDTVEWMRGPTHGPSNILQSFQKLKSYSCEGDITEDTFAKTTTGLPQLPELRSLSLSLTSRSPSPVESESLNFLSELHQLTCLDICLLYEDRCVPVAPLANLSNLVFLRFIGGKVKELPRALLNKPKLESLDLRCWVEISCVACLSPMQKLKKLCLCDVTVDENFFLSLESAPLTNLTLRDVKGINAAMLSGITKLEKLDKPNLCFHFDFEDCDLFKESGRLQALRYLTLESEMPLSVALKENNKRSFPFCRRIELN